MMARDAMSKVVSATAPSLHRENDWRVFMVTSLGVFIVFMNMTTMDVALPSIVRYFSATPTQASWILLGYMLVNTVMILAFGRLADIWGRKPLYLWGMGLFTVGSLLCGLSPTADWLIAFRVIQAIGAASIFTNNSALLADAFSAHRLPRVLGLNASLAAASSVCGPLIGGAMVASFDWRVLFFLNVPFGIVSLIYGPRVLRRHLSVAKGERFDVLGMLLSSLALGGLIFALSEGGMLGWSSTPVLLAFVVALASGIVFVMAQLHRRHPLVDFALLRDRRLVLAYYATFGVSIIQVSVVLLLSLFLQAARDLNALQAGARIMPLAAGLMVTAFFAGRLMARVSGHIMAAAGIALSCVSMLGLLISVSRADDHLALVVWMSLCGAGIGLFMTPNTTAILGAVPSERRGIANGLRSMMQNCGFVMGTALSLAIITGPLSTVGKNAIYSGNRAALSDMQVALFLGQYRAAFVALAVLAASCAIATYMRGRSPVRE
jgi:EmrB/QacA subfamily drug resistance transporter